MYIYSYAYIVISLYIVYDLDLDWVIPGRMGSFHFPGINFAGFFFGRFFFFFSEVTIFGWLNHIIS